MAKLICSDAMFLVGFLFVLMQPEKGQVTFKMNESRPSKRTQDALDELVEAGMVSVEPFNHYGGFVYTPLVSFKRPSTALAKRIGHWPITEPIEAGRAALAKEAQDHG